MFGHEDVSQGFIRFIVWCFLHVLTLSHVLIILLCVMPVVFQCIWHLYPSFCLFSALPD